MGSPILASDFNVQSFSGDICERLKKMLELHTKLYTFFDWLLNDDGTLSQAFLAELASVMVPTGAIVWYPRNSLPTGFLIANGAAVSRTTYAALYAVIGTEFGAGDGATTFNLPDLQQKFLMGAGGIYAVGATGGEASHTLTQAELPTSTVNLFGSTEEGEPVAQASLGTEVIARRLNVDSASQSYMLAKDEVNTTPSVGKSSPLGSGTAFNVLPPYKVGLWIIKT